MGNIVKLAVDNKTKPVPACDTCKHFYWRGGGLPAQCLATGGLWATAARQTECEYGALWEPKTPRISLWKRLFG